MENLENQNFNGVINSGNQSIHHYEVISSNIKSVTFSDSILFVEFHGGSVYSYKNVTFELFNMLAHAKSVGSFFNRNIKSNSDLFPFTRISNH